MAHYCPLSSSAGSLSGSGKRRGGRQAEETSVNFDTFVTSVYLPHVRQHKRSWAVDERIARQHLSASFGEFRLADISRSDVESWFRGLSGKGLAPTTCNRILSVFRSICSLALEYGAFPSGQSPCVRVSPLKVGVLRERYLTDEQAQRVMNELDHSERQEARAIKLLLLTGARKSEVLKARWEDVHLGQRLLTVPVSKSGRPRHIPLSDEAVAVIRSIPQEPGCPWLFPGRASGKPLSDLYLFWNSLRRKLSLRDIRIHDLRHTFASLLVNAGHSLYEVQKLLGHSDPRTTMRYAHLGQASLLAATQTVSARLGRPNRDKNSKPRRGAQHAMRPDGKRGSPRAGQMCKQYKH